MKRYFKPYSIVLYLLTFLVFVIIGAFVSAKLGAADGQGLAGGAIVLFNGIITGLVSVVVAFVLVRFATRKAIITINVILLVLLLSAIAAASLRDTHEEQDSEIPLPSKPTTPAPDADQD